MEQVFTVLGWFVLLTLTFGIARQLSSQPTIYQFPDSFGSAFASRGWDKGILENFSPAQTTASYSLLQDSQKIKHDGLGNLTAQTCYHADFLAQSQKTGNYIQRTNNFKHASPDSCTAPLGEFEDAMYMN
jgi:hypothetical protein